jgi:chaperonin cofactor prefoldin
MDFFKEKTDKNIESLKIIKKLPEKEKLWVNCGSLFIQMSNSNVVETLKKDQKVLYEDMKDLEKDMERKKEIISKLNSQ